ncbi:MAG: hypothetical protein HY308_03790 [Gammaproteobacteria bacterium]|nr:hypothetical protein [Gammaproteobacteria bacterium]
MRRDGRINWRIGPLGWLAVLVGVCTSVVGCTALPPTEPAVRAAAPLAAGRYGQALERFGELLDVYRARDSVLYVQARSSADVGERVRRAVGRIGDRVIYVTASADPTPSQAPDVLLIGALTATDSARKMSSFSFDVDLMDVERQQLVAGSHSVNTVRVFDEPQDNFDFALYGAGFGLVTSRKYLAEQNEAMQLLVDLSVVQVIGRYLSVPYWRCLPSTQADPLVIEHIEKRYAKLDGPTRVKWLQATLTSYGFDLNFTGMLDEKTTFAIDQVATRLKFPRRVDYLDVGLFVDLYVNVPIKSMRRAAALPVQTVAG